MYRVLFILKKILFGSKLGSNSHEKSANAHKHYILQEKLYLILYNQPVFVNVYHIPDSFRKRAESVQA